MGEQLSDGIASRSSTRGTKPAKPLDNDVTVTSAAARRCIRRNRSLTSVGFIVGPPRSSRPHRVVPGPEPLTREQLFGRTELGHRLARTARRLPRLRLDRLHDGRVRLLHLELALLEKKDVSDR